MNIAKVEVVSNRFRNDFQNRLVGTINDMQSQGLDVEIQYSISEDNYSALVIGRKPMTMVLK